MDPQSLELLYCCIYCLLFSKNSLAIGFNVYCGLKLMSRNNTKCGGRGGLLTSTHILSTAVAYFCVIADNDFLNDPHNLIYSWILLMLISLYVPVP